MSLSSNGSVCYGCVMRRNCKYQPRESLEHPQVSFTVSSNGPVLRQSPSPQLSSSLTGAVKRNIRRFIIRRTGKNSHETYWTVENPQRKICHYNFYDRLEPEHSQDILLISPVTTVLASDHFRIGIILSTDFVPITLIFKFQERTRILLMLLVANLTLRVTFQSI